MDKKAAAEKVAKLQRVATNPSTNVHEAENARQQAKKLIEQYQITENDLGAGQSAAAFDEILDNLQKYIVSHPYLPGGLFNTSSVVQDVLEKIRKMPETDKHQKLKQVSFILRTISLFSGTNQTLNEVNAIFDSALSNHNVKL